MYSGATSIWQLGARNGPVSQLTRTSCTVRAWAGITTVFAPCYTAAAFDVNFAPKFRAFWWYFDSLGVPSNDYLGRKWCTAITTLSWRHVYTWHNRHADVTEMSCGWHVNVCVRWSGAMPGEIIQHVMHMTTADASLQVSKLASFRHDITHVYAFVCVQCLASSTLWHQLKHRCHFPTTAHTLWNYRAFIYVNWGAIKKNLVFVPIKFYFNAFTLFKGANDYYHYMNSYLFKIFETLLR